MLHPYLQALLTGDRRIVEDQSRIIARKAARIAWSMQALELLKAAQQRAEQAWDRLLSTLPEDADDDEYDALPPPPEDAEVQAMWAEIRAVLDHDKWPRELHWGGV